MTDATPRRDDEELEDEREFLLRSLDDLDAELLAGQHRSRHLPRAARRLHRARVGGHPVDRRRRRARGAPDAPRVPPLMRVLTIGGIVVFAVLAAVLLAHTVGQRRPGQQITGDAQAGPPTTVSPRDRDRHGEGGRDGRSRRATTRASATPARCFGAGTVPGRDPGVHRGREARSRRRPNRSRTRAGSPRCSPAATTDATRTHALLDAAERSLDRAIAVDPTYPDSYVFKGLLLTQIENKQCEGAVAFQQFLATAPTDHPLRPQVLTALAAAVKAGNCPTALDHPHHQAVRSPSWPPQDARTADRRRRRSTA